MAKTFLSKGDVITVVCPSGGVSSGDPVLIGSLFGVALHDAVAAADLEIGTVGEYTLPADNTITFSQGDRLFWDSTNGWVDKTATAQSCVGIATADKASSATTAPVLLRATTPAGS